MKFLDEAKISVCSGHGGPGSVSFRREKFIPMGGPDGGDGGKGGDILFMADHNLSTLIDFRYKRKYIAQDGNSGEGQKKKGKDATDISIRVPVGTVIRDASTRELLADLIHHDQTYIALQGGRGGKGNHFFKNSLRQAPQFSQPGEAGTSREVILELKLLADVGLIGFPNAGKSTLISRISKARPKIADYPFTTLTPNLGVVSVSQGECFVVADIPGLIEGAHEGAGLGIKFLKHIERTSLLLHLIDISQPNPWHQFTVLNHELTSYSTKLSKKMQIIVLTKTDLLPDPKAAAQVTDSFKKRGFSVLAISSVTGSGLSTLLYTVSDSLKQIAAS